MPLLSGLFSRKNKSSPRPKRDEPTDSLYSGTTASELESNLSSPTSSSYVTPGKSLPSYPNVRSLPHPEPTRDMLAKNVYAPSMPSTPSPSSGSKLRLFGRKKSNIPVSDLSTETSTKNFNTSPRPPANRTSTDTESTENRRLRPPPSRSAIFAAYGDPNSALSTRSLPNDHSLASAAADLSAESSLQPQKRPSLFPWAKQSSPSPTSLRLNVSTPASQNSPTTPTSPDASHSFNLKSFRHVRAPSPTRSNASNVSLTPPVVPRPRGQSVNSDASQRISVAAFREAQARRSLAGSPVPSFRSPSPAPALPRSTSPEEARPRPTRSIPSMPSAVQQQRRRSSMALAYTSDDSDSSCSPSEESEDETVQQRRGTRPSSFGKPGRMDKPKAKSEIGHGRTPDAAPKSTDHPRPPRAAKSHAGHSFSPSPSSREASTSITRPAENRKIPEVPSRSQSSLSHYAGGGVRQRASASTSALTPSAAAKRASILVGDNSNISNHTKVEDRAPSGPSRNAPQLPQTIARPPVQAGAGAQARGRKAEDSSDSDSDDNAPLASLVGAKRPGSAMSSYSNLHSRSTGNVTTRSITHLPPKPLIDINELTGPKRSYTTPVEKNAAGFTEGSTLLAQGKPSSYSQKPIVESPVSLSPPMRHYIADENLPPITRTAPPVKFISPPDSPAKDLEQFVSKSDLQTTQVKADFNAVSPAPTPGTSPEPKRDAITDRLTKVVQKNRSQNAVSVAQQFPTALKSKSSRDTSPESDDVSDNAPPPRKVVQAPVAALRSTRVEIPTTKPPVVKDDYSPPDEELAQLLGTAGIKFISRTGDTSEDSTESDSDEEEEEDAKSTETANKNRIAPIPIKQRSPPPSFSVTSRPPIHRRENTNSTSSTSSPLANEKTTTTDYTRPRSITLTDPSPSTAFPPRKPSISASVATSFSSSKASSSTSNTGNSNATNQVKVERNNAPKPASGVRQRSSTMLTGVPLASQMPRVSHAPEKPFAGRRNSPASSTGDSSSGRAPLTPRDGSDIGGQDAKKKGHVQRRSVSFEDDLQDLRPPSRTHLRESKRSGSDAGDTSNDEDREERRRERRRGEAKAAIELGKVINGPGPIVDDDDEDMPINQAMNMNPRMSTLSMNPMMGMSPPMSMSMPMGFGAPNPAGWGANMGMMSPASFMVPPPADPSFMVAHQQAMMIAKQAYQMAVAQQAMAAAGDEWERGSAVGGYGGGSVYGGSTSPSMPAIPAMMAPSYGMMGMMQGGNWPSSSSVYGGGGARSMYGATLRPQDGMLSSSRSEYGGVSSRGGGGNWSSSRSSYGESFGPSSDQYGRKGAPAGRRPGNQPRDSGYFPPVPPMPAMQSANGRSSPDGRANPRSRTTSQPASPGRPRKAPPPSSWKAAGS